MPEIPYCGVWVEKLLLKIIYDYDVILMWSKHLTTFGLKTSILRRSSATVHRRSTQVVSKCSEGSIFYQQSCSREIEGMPASKNVETRGNLSSR